MKETKKRKNENEKKMKKNEIQDSNLKEGEIAFEDELFRKFNDIIESDEKIVQGYKPVKSKVFASNFLCWFVVLGLFMVVAMLILWLDSTVAMSEKIIGTSIVGGIFVILFAFVLWFTILYYKNTYYVYTNKRIIIRTGIFGVDFHSLDIKNIGASDVTVSLLDKILRKNTGSIKFGSNSSPINGQNTLNYGFLHVKNPYQVHKEIKEYIKSL